MITVIPVAPSPSSVEGFSAIAERRRRVGRTKSASKPAKMRSHADRLGDRCQERFTISPDCVFDASLVPETCLELPGFAILMWDSVRQAKADS